MKNWWTHGTQKKGQEAEEVLERALSEADNTEGLCPQCGQRLTQAGTKRKCKPCGYVEHADG